MIRLMRLRMGLLVGNFALVAMLVSGCSAKAEKNCGDSCSDDSECVSGHKCLTVSGSKQCVPEECQGCGSQSTCVYSSPTDGKCSFLQCN